MAKKTFTKNWHYWADIHITCGQISNKIIPLNDYVWLKQATSPNLTPSCNIFLENQTVDGEG